MGKLHASVSPVCNGPESLTGQIHWIRAFLVLGSHTWIMNLRPIKTNGSVFWVLDTDNHTVDLEDQYICANTQSRDDPNSLMLTNVHVLLGVRVAYGLYVDDGHERVILIWMVLQIYVTITTLYSEECINEKGRKYPCHESLPYLTQQNQPRDFSQLWASCDLYSDPLMVHCSYTSQLCVLAIVHHPSIIIGRVA